MADSAPWPGVHMALLKWGLILDVTACMLPAWIKIGLLPGDTGSCITGAAVPEINPLYWGSDGRGGVDMRVAALLG